MPTNREGDMGNSHNEADYEKNAYWYHSDHLGSSSYISNLHGDITQHMEYLPFEFIYLEETEVELNEGKYHLGKGSVIHFMATKNG